MSQSVAEIPSAAPAVARDSWLKPALIALVLLGIWAELVSKLMTDWSTNQQYEFGPFVPFFIAVLLFRRWADRPAARTAGSRLPLIFAGAALLLLLLPIRVVQEANPDWRPLNWVHCLVVVALTLAALASVGGKPWVRHFGVPLLLVFFAIPWPLATEQGVIQFLTRRVTSGTAELLNGCGIPAFPRGNVIELATGVVGINQACSGIRSLAATLMAAAFFGEFYRLSWFRRGALIVAGVAVAFALNLVRAFVLSYVQAQYGSGAFHAWHDKTGLAIFAVSFAILWSAASLLARWRSDSLVTTDDASQDSLSHLAKGIPLWVPAMILLWLGVVELGNEWWFRHRERDLPPAPNWSVAWPAGSPALTFNEVPDEVKSILRYSDASTGIIHEPGLPIWQLYFIRWAPGRTSSQLAVMHRPEICLPATGLHYVSDGGVVNVQAQGLSLPFHGSVFEANGQRLYVYRCLWEDRSAEGASRDRGFDISVLGRLKATWEGQRNLGQKLLQVGIVGVGDEQEAREDLQRRLPRLIAAG